MDDNRMFVRIAAIVLVAFAITMAVVEMTRPEEDPSAPTVRLLPPPVDPLREGQRRCQQLGEAAASNAECLRIWAETRDRFLGRNRQEAP